MSVCLSVCVCVSIADANVLCLMDLETGPRPTGGSFFFGHQQIVNDEFRPSSCVWWLVVVSVYELRSVTLKAHLKSLQLKMNVRPSQAGKGGSWNVFVASG